MPAKYKVIAGSLILAIVALVFFGGIIYLYRPTFAWNLISVGPRLIIEFPLRQSIALHNFDNAVSLLNKQIRYSELLGLTDAHKIEIERTLLELIQYAQRPQDYDRLVELFSESLPTYESTFLDGLRLLANTYRSRAENHVSDVQSLTDNNNELSQTLFQRFWLVAQHRLDKTRQEDNSATLCELGDSGSNPLRYRNFSKIKVSDFGFDVPLLVPDFQETGSGDWILGSPILLNTGIVSQILELPTPKPNLSSLRIHIFTRPGTVIKLSNLRIGDHEMLVSSDLAFLKYGFFLDNNTIILTEPHDTLVIDFPSGREPVGESLLVEAEIRLANSASANCN